MKTMCAFAIIALVCAEKPVISLDLEEAAAIKMADLCTSELRPRSSTVSYRTDENFEIMNDGGLDGLDEIDRKILSAAILNVDITEVHSPERIASIAKKFGLVSGSSLDLTNGSAQKQEPVSRKSSS